MSSGVQAQVADREGKEIEMNAIIPPPIWLMRNQGYDMTGKDLLIGIAIGIVFCWVIATVTIWMCEVGDGKSTTLFQQLRKQVLFLKKLRLFLVIS